MFEIHSHQRNTNQKESYTINCLDRKSINDAPQGIRIHCEFDNLVAMKQFFQSKTEAVTVDSRAPPHLILSFRLGSREGRTRQIASQQYGHLTVAFDMPTRM